MAWIPFLWFTSKVHAVFLFSLNFISWQHCLLWNNVQPKGSFANLEWCPRKSGFRIFWPTLATVSLKGHLTLLRCGRYWVLQWSVMGSFASRMVWLLEGMILRALLFCFSFFHFFYLIDLVLWYCKKIKIYKPQDPDCLGSIISMVKFFGSIVKVFVSSSNPSWG